MLYFLGKQRSEDLKREAALHGAKIEGESKPGGAADSIKFKDPKEYEKLSPAERKRLTEEMLGKMGVMPVLGEVKKVKVPKESRVK